jgi:hypothetical protein
MGGSKKEPRPLLATRCSGKSAFRPEPDLTTQLNDIEEAK